MQWEMKFLIYNIVYIVPDLLHLKSVKLATYFEKKAKGCLRNFSAVPIENLSDKKIIAFFEIY